MVTAETAFLVPAAELRRLAARILAAAGAGDDVAEPVAASLVLANLRGVDSHGVMRVPDYLDEIRGGRIVANAKPTVDTNSGAIVRVAGNRCFGQLAARVATLAAIERARAFGVGVAVIGGVFHIGRLGEFVELAAEHGYVSLLAANGGPPGGIVAPYGGRGRALGTNPIAFGIPAGSRPAVVADFSTSAAAEGKVRLLREAGRLLPEGWLLDADGNPSTDPADLYAGGALLPAGGHKGFALGLLVEILGGVLAGAGCAVLGENPGNGCVLVVIDPAAVLPAAEFESGVERVVEAIERQPPRAGFPAVVVPGAPEAAAEAARAENGIPFSAATWRRIAEGARSVGIDLEREELPRVRDTG